MASIKPPLSSSFHSLENLSPEDRVLFHRFGCGRSAEAPYNIIHHAFEAIATAHGEVTAVHQHDGTTISYAALNQRANILANELRAQHGFSKGDRAVLVFSRSVDMVVFVLAVLKAGGQYVPVDGGVVPTETLSHIVADSEASVLLCMPKFKEKVGESVSLARRTSVAIVSVDGNSNLWTNGDDSDPAVQVSPQDGAYVIYTSGTTGLPKGVDVTHGGVTNTLLLEPAKLGITVGKKVAQQLNVGFDMGAWEILATIMNGGTLYTRGSGNGNWHNCLRQVDIVISTPTVALKHFPNHDGFPNLETIVVGGEPCPETLANHWAPYVNFLNVCGPTEISVMNTAHVHRPGERLTIGKPIANTTLYLLDDDENPVPIGAPGIMWVGGAGVSRGYLNLPELTAIRYKPDKFTNDGGMMFNTGDLARWLPDGSLETLGRKDDQVKIHGFRVELDGVSRAIETHTAVIKACALKINHDLWGFYSSGAPVDEAELRQTVAANQPFYAVPALWCHVATIPLTANGKIDKRMLCELAAPPSNHSRSTLFDLNPNARDVEKAPESDKSSETAEREKLGEEEETELPPKNGFHGWRWLRHTALSAYRKLFGTILVANAAALSVMLWNSCRDDYRLPLASLATAVSANLLASVLLRQDYVVNFAFWLATRLPTSAPLSIRRHLARVYHYGGIHSGCAVAASLWWLIFTISATLSPPSRHQAAILALTYMILALLLGILTMAYPTVRARLHDQFEWTHRFAGWAALVLVWAHLLLTTTASSSPASPGMTALAKTPTLYLLALTTLSIALPWLRLRQVSVSAEPLSAHAVRLHFDFMTPRPGSSLGIRITDRPLVEWHAFAAIPSIDGKGFSILVSQAGDWTTKIIQNPPTRIWTRGEPASGVLAAACLFRKVVLVATGSGIGPCLPVILERKVPCRILWSTRNAEKTYRRGILNEVRRADADAVVWDTDEMGRPDLVRLSWDLYRESGAECVCIVSNARTTKRVVYQLEARGIPAFGPIWDS